MTAMCLALISANHAGAEYAGYKLAILRYLIMKRKPPNSYHYSQQGQHPRELFADDASLAVHPWPIVKSPRTGDVHDVVIPA